MRTLCAFIVALIAVTVPNDARVPSERHEVSAERWHLIAHLRDSEGNRYDASITFFRYRVNAAESFFPVTCAMVSERNRRSFTATRAERSTNGLAALHTNPLIVAVDDWSLGETAAKDWRRRQFTVAVRTQAFSLDLNAAPLKPPVRYGSESSAYTRLRTSGTLHIDGVAFAVSGSAWLEDDAGTAVPTLIGERWDLFEIMLDDGRDILLRFRYRRGFAVLDRGLVIASSGSVRVLSAQDVHIENPLHTKWISPQTGIRYPSLWEIVIPRARLDEAVIPPVQNQEIVSQQGGPASYDASVEVERAPPPGGDFGRGYVEEIGYEAH